MIALSSRQHWDYSVRVYNQFSTVHQRAVDHEWTARLPIHYLLNFNETSRRTHDLDPGAEATSIADTVHHDVKVTLTFCSGYIHGMN